MVLNIHKQDFPGGPVVKNLPSNAGNTGSILSGGTKIPLESEQLRMSYLKYQPIGRPDSEFLGPHWECRPQNPASGFESWSFPNILVLNFFFATNKTMFRTNINALKPTMVLWSPVNRSRFLKTDVFVFKMHRLFELSKSFTNPRRFNVQMWEKTTVVLQKMMLVCSHLLAAI